MKSYSELSKLTTFRDRFLYLKLSGSVGFPTFGPERQLNQDFYHSPEWKRVRDYVILRDMGCDLGIPGNDIFGTIHIHHMNPISPSDIIHRNEDILDPEYLICVSTKTHNAIHYGDDDILDFGLIERKPYDTCPWKKGGK